MAWAFSIVPPLSKYAVMPVARKVWQHIRSAEMPAARPRRLTMRSTSVRLICFDDNCCDFPTALPVVAKERAAAEDEHADHLNRHSHPGPRSNGSTKCSAVSHQLEAGPPVALQDSKAGRSVGDGCLPECRGGHFTERLAGAE